MVYNGGGMMERWREWLKQADYDMDTADAMLASGRNLYALFMCHLSVEKALKALYEYRLREVPPKTHNLLFLLGKIGIDPPQEIEKLPIRLNTLGVATRYPNDLDTMLRDYPEKRTAGIISDAKGFVQWIKKQF